MRSVMAVVTEWQPPDFQYAQPLEPYLMLALLGALSFGIARTTAHRALPGVAISFPNLATAPKCSNSLAAADDYDGSRSRRGHCRCVGYQGGQH
jgi:hypothetical protein